MKICLLEVEDMDRERFERRCRIEASAQETFRWHTRPGAFERLTPPWERVEVVRKVGGITNGSRVTVRVRIGPFSQLCTFQHLDYQEGVQFRDVQVEGPFKYWDHIHRIEAAGERVSYLEDRIEYVLPLGILGRLFGAAFIRRKLHRLFTYRHQVTRSDIEMHSRYSSNGAMRILITGSSGMVGSALIPMLTAGGHKVSRLVRRRAVNEGEVAWDPVSGDIDRERLEGFDAVVHLAGDNIGEGRWTEDKKQRIRDSRVRATKLLSSALSGLNSPPRVLVSSSAIGYYGDRDSEILREESAPGKGFLADVCREWEAATQAASDAGIRVVNLRIGVVLAPQGGALKKMLLPFQIGMGGQIGSGKQYMSWIALDDLLGAIYHSIVNEELRGAVNAVSPNPVTNREFTETLAKVMSRPALLPVPSFALKLALGEMAEETALSSARVHPSRLLSTDYRFRLADLSQALEHCLGRVRPF